MITWADRNDDGLVSFDEYQRVIRILAAAVFEPKYRVVCIRATNVQVALETSLESERLVRCGGGTVGWAWYGPGRGARRLARCAVSTLIRHAHVQVRLQ
eukprot:755492-Prymnesium_polylepis.1